MSRTQAFAAGAERSTEQFHQEQGAMWRRDPVNGHGTVVNNATSKFGQQHLFNPESVSDIPFHAMSPRQFAASPHVWWHGRYGEDLPSDSYVEDYGSSGEWADSAEEDKEGYHGIHFGTRKAAEDRLKTLGPGRPQSEGEDWDLSRDPDTPKVGSEPRIRGRLFPVTLSHHQFRETLGFDMGENEKWRREMGYEEPSAKGMFYQNQAEDVGSISAVVPERESSIRTMGSRNGAFFNSWNDHVLAADPDTVHPALRWAAQHAPEHTGEDYIHPDDSKAAQEELRRSGGFRAGESVQQPLFIHYSGGERRSHQLGERPGYPIMTTPAKYLDRNHKNTLGSIEVGG